MRTAAILLLRWQRFFAQLAVDIDRAQVEAHTPSLERNLKRLARIESQIVQRESARALIRRMG